MAATVEDLKRRFAEFDAVGDDVVQDWLDQALVVFPDDDKYQIIQACHDMAVVGYGTSTESELHREGLTGATDIATGTLRLSFNNKQPGGETNQYMTTKYGRMLWPKLRARSFGTTGATGTVDSASWVS